MSDLLKSYAALWGTHQELVGDLWRIDVADSAVSLLKDIQPNLIASADMIIDQNAERINLLAPEEAFEEFQQGDGPWPERSFVDVTKLLRKRLADDILAPSLGSIEGTWYDVMDFCNTNEDYLSIFLEGPLDRFLQDILLQESQALAHENLLSFRDGKWLVDLRGLVSRPHWQEVLDNRKRLFELFEEFSERHSSV